MKNKLFIFVGMLLLMVASVNAIETDDFLMYYSFSEGNGDAIDSINGINGTLFNNVTYSTNYPIFPTNGDGSEYSIIFDGDGDAIEINDSLIADNEKGSVTAWIYPTSLGNQVVIGYAVRTDAYPYLFIMTDTEGRLKYQKRYTVSTVQHIGTKTMSLNNWHFITVMSDDSEISFYINGTQDPFTTSAVNDGTWYGTPVGVSYTQPNALSIGAYFLYADTFNLEYTGSIDEVRFFNDTLNSTEIYNIYNTGNINAVVPNVAPNPVTIINPVNDSEFVLNISGVDIFFNWSASDDISENISYRVGVGNDTYVTDYLSGWITDNNYTHSFSSLLWGSELLKTYVFVNDSEFVTNSSQTGFFSLCKNNYVDYTTTCINNSQTVYYIDSANCSIEYNKPSNSTQSCGVEDEETPSTSGGYNPYTLELLLWIAFIFFVGLIGFLAVPILISFDGLMIIVFGMFALDKFFTDEPTLIIFKVLLVLIGLILMIAGITYKKS